MTPRRGPLLSAAAGDTRGRRDCTLRRVRRLEALRRTPDSP